MFLSDLSIKRPVLITMVVAALLIFGVLGFVNLPLNLMPDAPVSDVVELASLAESLGYRRCWVYDEGLVTRDVYVTLTAIAQATTSMRISGSKRASCSSVWLFIVAVVATLSMRTRARRQAGFRVSK